MLLHPVGLDGRSFQFLASPKLANAVRYDCLWHGGRRKPAGMLTIETMAKDVVEHTDGALDLVGVSMGGQVAQRIAMLFPERVRSLLITSGANPPSTELDSEYTTPPWEQAEVLKQRGMDNVVDWALPRWFSPAALADRQHPGVQYARRRLMGDTTEQFAAGWAALAARRPSLEQQIESLTMPTTVLHPTDDHTTLESCRLLVESLPEARLVACKGPHMVHLEEPAAFEAAVLEHLDWANLRDMGS